jgi:hypothetical protein
MDRARSSSAFRLGALIFAPGRRRPPVHATGRNLDLATLAEAARPLEAGLEADPDSLQMLFATGRSLGGARPKALVSDGTGERVAKKGGAKQTSTEGRRAPALRGIASYSGSTSPDPPISLGTSFILGSPSLIRRTVS